MVLPIEFVVIGKPISHQTKDKKRLQAWKDEVRQAAAQFWLNQQPLGAFLKVVITHYYDALAGDETWVPDSDNKVRSRKTLTRNGAEDLRHISQSVCNLPGWEFELVVTNARKKSNSVPS